MSLLHYVYCNETVINELTANKPAANEPTTNKEPATNKLATNKPASTHLLVNYFTICSFIHLFNFPKLGTSLSIQLADG